MARGRLAPPLAAPRPPRQPLRRQRSLSATKIFLRTYLGGSGPAWPCSRESGAGGFPCAPYWYVLAYGVRAGPLELGGVVRVSRVRMTDSWAAGGRRAQVPRSPAGVGLGLRRPRRQSRDETGAWTRASRHEAPAPISETRAEPQQQVAGPGRGDPAAGAERGWPAATGASSRRLSLLGPEPCPQLPESLCG